MFGKFRIKPDLASSPLEFDSRLAKELLVFLFLNRNQYHNREALADLFWKDKSANRSKKYLRQSLWKIQSVFNPSSIEIENHILIIEPNWVYINPTADLWFDVTELENTFNAMWGKPGWSLSLAQLDTLKRITDLYQGDLVEGFYKDWCLVERERYRFMYLALLDKIVSCCQAHQEYEMGLKYAAIILQHDRARERTYRRLMRLYYLMGNRTSALRQYENCIKVLDEELGVKPGRQTEKLHKMIENDNRAEIKSSIDGAPLIQNPSLIGSNDLLDQLMQLNKFLIDTQYEVQKKIRNVQRLTENNL
jgi:DNA-binding SARP family transcriptional activator